MQGILAYLSGRQISEACSLAQDAGDDRLALLLAQAAGSDVTRQMVAVQLAKWAEMEVRGNFQPAEVFFSAVLKHTATDPRDWDACALEWAGLS